MTRSSEVRALLPATARPLLRPSDAPDVAAYDGWLIIAVFFGLLGSWALLAPLNGAVVADAVVKIDGNRKSIQHLEGGIVREVRVRDGASVVAGEPLVVLDDTQAQAEVEVLDQLATVLKLTEGRLQTEQEGGAELHLPSALAGRAEEREVVAAWRSQITQLDARRREMAGQAQLIGQRIAQIEAQIVGARAQLQSLTRQRNSMRDELDSLAPLLERGIVTRTRLLQLERSLAALEGQIGEVNASIARSEQAAGEQRQLEVQTGNTRATAIAQELRDVQMKLAEVLPKLANARSVHARTVVKAPYSGRVVGLNVFAVGGVIGRGERLMDIVPEQGALIVEAKVAVQDVAEIASETLAEVRLTGYKQQTTPALHGTVVHVSADRLTEERSGTPYYLAKVHIDEDELAAAPEIRLQPGMSATVIIPTTSRTAFQYLTAPLWATLNTALRER